MAYVLAYEVNDLCKRFGVEMSGFLTLTVGDKQAPCLKEVQRRFNSLRTGLLADRYERAIFVVERGETKKRLHLHGVVVVGRDIRTASHGNGPVDFEAFERGDYRSANGNLRSEWAFWREAAPRYGFGRTELLPIKSNAEGIARYVGSYIKKQIMNRVGEDKGARLVRFVNYGPGDRKASTRLAWATERAWLWRKKVGAWAASFGLHSMREITEACGPRWAYVFKDQILGTRLPAGTMYPSAACAHYDIEDWLTRQARNWNVVREAERNSPWNKTRTVLLGKEVTDYDQRPF